MSASQWRVRRAYLAVLRAAANPEPEPVETAPEPAQDPLADARAALVPLQAWNRLTRGPLHRARP